MPTGRKTPPVIIKVPSDVTVGYIVTVLGEAVFVTVVVLSATEVPALLWSVSVKVVEV